MVDPAPSWIKYVGAISKDEPNTKGWDLNVKWHDGTADWIPVKDLKDGNPVEMAEHGVTAKLADEPEFAWWIRDVL